MALSTAKRPNERLAPSFRSPRRVTVTLAQQTYEHLLQRSDCEGRSLSNLAAFLLELGLRQPSEVADRPTSSAADRGRKPE